MLALVEAAAEYWEDIIEDPGTLQITCVYDTTITGVGRFDNDLDDGMKVKQATLKFDPTPNFADPGTPPVPVRWYFDQTPNDHSEFSLAPTLYSDLSQLQQQSFMTGSPPSNLEVSYYSPANAGSPATGLWDFYTVALHEIGHALGMSVKFAPCGVRQFDNNGNAMVDANNKLIILSGEIVDCDFDFFPSMINGATAAFLVDTQGGGHVSRGTVTANVPTIFPLMNTNVGSNNRRLPSAADVLAIATCPSPGWSQIDLPRKDFLRGGSSDWNSSGNWIGNQLPDSQDDVFVRLVNSGSTAFPVNLSAGERIENLTVGNFSVVSTGNNRLGVDRTTSILHDGGTFDFPAIKVDGNGELDTLDLLMQGGTLRMNGGLVDIGRTLDVGTLNGRASRVRGFGTIDVTDHVTGTINVSGKLINEGSIVAEGGNTLTLQSTGVSIWDLDGESEGGEVIAVDGNLNISGGHLTDPFSSTMTVGSGRSITIAEDWIVDGAGAELTFVGTGTAATFDGAGSLDFVNGRIAVDGDGRFSNPVVLRADTELEVATGRVLDFDAGATLRGGSYTGGGRLRFNDRLIVNSPTTFDNALVDLDGSTGNTEIDLNAALTINSGTFDPKFDGTLNITSVFASLNVIGIEPSWQMDGVMNVTGSRTFGFAMLSGTPVEISGMANVTSRSIWNARTTISGGVAMLSDANDRLVLRGGSVFQPNRIENGSVGFFGTFELNDNAWLSGWGLISSITDIRSGCGMLADDGVLILARAPGLANSTTLGTADSDGTLQVNPSWSLPSGATLQLAGGAITGGTITNQSLITGHGTIAADQLVNSGEIRADGGTLIIDTAIAPDLDGSSSPLGTLFAVDGDLTILDALNDDFNGEVTVGFGRRILFDGGFTLANTGNLILDGSASDAARLIGTDNIIHGEVEVTGLAELDAHRFGSSSEITFAANSTLTITSPTTISALATFTAGAGAKLVSAEDFTLADFADVGVASILTGDIEIGTGNTIATATLTNPDFQNGTSLGIDLTSTTSDQLMINGALQVDGRLRLDFDHPTAKAGDRWKIISGSSISGRFDRITSVGLSGDLEPVAYVLSDGVYIKLQESTIYEKWAIIQDLPAGENGIDHDPDGDGLTNGFEAISGTDPLDPRSTPAITFQPIDLDGITYLSLSFERETHTVITDLGLNFRRSVDLVKWTDNNTGSLGVVFDPVNSVETHRYFSKIPIGSAGSEFLRFELVFTP